MSRAKPKRLASMPAVAEQAWMAFNLYEALRCILKDLHAIDMLIPRETSRHARKDMDTEKFLLIQQRKDDLLRYIQTICRDHMRWGADLITQGWTPELKQKARKPPKSDLRDWLKKQLSG